MDRAKCLLVVAPSEDVSGTVRSALTAKAESFPKADIRLLDTRTVGGNLATMVQLAVGWAEQGMGPEDILARLKAMIPRSRTYFLVTTLEYLRRGGRIGGASALVGSALQIKPILQIQDGHVEVLEKVRTENRAVERLKELVERDCPRGAEGHLCVMHAADREGAEALGLGPVPPNGSVIHTGLHDGGGDHHACRAGYAGGWVLHDGLAGTPPTSPSMAARAYGCSLTASARTSGAVCRT